MAVRKKSSRPAGARTPRLGSIRDDLRKKGVKYCYSAYVDVHGVPKGKAVPIEHFERMMRGSELFTGAALDGLGQGPHDDELAVYPDPAAVTQLPWEPEVAWCPGNLKYHEEPWPMCSRTILQQQVERAAKLGFTFNLGIECEVYIVRREGNGIVPNQDRDNLAKAAYDFAGTLLNYRFLDEIVSAMNSLGWDVHSFDHEDANGQFEFDFAYADALTMADRFVLWRLMMKEITRRYGWEATCMPKPYADRTGSGAHFNMSLADVKTGKNLCGDAQRRARLRPVQARLPVPGRSQEARGGNRRHHLPDRELLQASHQDRLHDRLYLGAGVRLLRRQQPHPHAAGAQAPAAHRGHRQGARPVSLGGAPGMPSRGPRDEPLPGRGDDACRGPGGDRERPRPRRSHRREHVPAERRPAPAQGGSSCCRAPCWRQSRRSPPTRSASR